MWDIAQKSAEKVAALIAGVISSLADYMLNDPDRAADRETRRRIALLAGISIIGLITTAIFGVVAFLQGSPVLGCVDVAVSLVLLANLLDLKKRGRLFFNVAVGVVILSVFFTFLYVTGGVNQSAHVWYFVYPLVVMYVLGSRLGILAAGIMTAPVLGMMLLRPDNVNLAAYQFDFEIRFLFAYLVVALYAFFIEHSAEKHRLEIGAINEQLERAVKERTEELEATIERLEISRRQLHKSERLYRVMFEKTVNAVFLVDLPTGRYVDANPAAEQLTGRSRQELQRLFTKDVTPESAHERLEKLSMNGTPVIDRDIVHYVRADGSKRTALFNAIALDEQLAMGIAQDITEVERANNERKKLETRLNHARKMEAIGELAGGVAHDLNNILAGIVSYPQLIRAKLPPGSELDQPLKIIEQSGRRAAVVVNDLLTYARNAASVKEPTDLTKIAVDLLNSPEWRNIAAEHREVTMVTELSAEIPLISCSPVHIRKCLMNLLHNAFEAVSATGNVVLKIHNIQLPDSEELGDEPGQLQDEVVLEVHDNGPGISDEQIEHIFEPFYSTKKMGRSGSGLGLSVVWNTVVEHDGTIEVERLDPGTAFILSFPGLNDDPAAEIDLTDSQADVLHGTGQVLVIDDEPSLRKIACDILEMLGYEVSTVASGEEAVRYLNHNQADIILLDMFLGDGMGGYETYKRIRELNPCQKAIIVSGYSTSSEVKKTLDLGASGIVSKPYSVEELGKTVKTVVRPGEPCCNVS